MTPEADVDLINSLGIEGHELGESVGIADTMSRCAADPYSIAKAPARRREAPAEHFIAVGGNQGDAILATLTRMAANIGMISMFVYVAGDDPVRLVANFLHVCFQKSRDFSREDSFSRFDFNDGDICLGSHSRNWQKQTRACQGFRAGEDVDEGILTWARLMPGLVWDLRRAV